MKRTLLCTLLLAAACGDDSTDPGSLIRVTADGQVGVLLDDYPAASRERIATAVLAMDDDFWRERARRQLRMTNLRLVYRNLYYDAADNKNALTLPPEAVWELTLHAAGAQRVTIDGHDLVAVDYTLSSALLSDIDSPQVSEPALGEIGGTWQEDFVLPVDPTMLLQRSGYACVDEDQFPLESVDSENAYEFYDDYCEVETIDTVSCHLTELPDQSCVDALESAIGRVDVALQYERVAWDDALAEQVRHGQVTTPDGPDLAVVTEGFLSLSNHRVVYKYFGDGHCAVSEGCVGGPGWRRLIAFDSMDHNQGGAALHIGPVDYADEGLGTELAEHGVYELSACHGHYHFAFYGDFGFGDEASAEVQKNGFCIESTSRLSNNESTPLHTEYVCENQGLSAGWGDLYAAGLTCNWVDVTDVDTSGGAVTQSLFFRSNPDGFLCEGELMVDGDGEQLWEETEFRTAGGDIVYRPMCAETAGTEANDLGMVDAVLPETGGMLTSACADGQALGPLRNCGYDVQLTLPTCTPGAETTITCTGGDATHPQAMRLCEASRALARPVDCLHEDALAQTVVEGNATQITFTCPGPRDVTEVGGQYAIYSAPAWAPDGAMPVTCN